MVFSIKHRFLFRCISSLIVYLLLFFQVCFPVFANPFLFIEGDQILTGGNHRWFVRLNSDGTRIGALQTSVRIDSDYFDIIQIGTQNTICNVWSPADSVPPGENLTRVTPYVSGGKLVLSCGITGNGYLGTQGLVTSFTLKPIQDGQTEFFFANTKYAYLGSNIVPGAEDHFSMTIYNWNLDPTATQSAIPTPTPKISSSAAIITTRTLFSDVKFQQWNPKTRSSAGAGTSSVTGSSISDLDVVEEDNTVPPPPPGMTPRPTKAPYTLADMANVEPATESGEVKAIQSLRDLLIPGKSQADKTVVLINFLSTITFLIILAIILWRMMTNSRTAKLKSQYINELISGELSALETKMEIVGEKSGKDHYKEEFEEAVQHILEEVSPRKAKKGTKKEVNPMTSK